MAESDSIVFNLSKKFAVRIVKPYKHLVGEGKEFAMSRQILRSGTSIGANIAEALNAFSRPDFVYKMQIARKEAAETAYWLELLHATDYLNDLGFESLSRDCSTIEAMLTAILKSTKANTPRL